MNSFKLYHYDKEKKLFLYITDSQGFLNKEQGIPVFTPIFENYLDEALDECYITVYGSEIPNYTPTDIFKLVFEEDSSTAATAYYTLAEDEAYEYPIGSGYYKHTLHLIEPTKLLEGVVCQSITFTNNLGTTNLNAQIEVPPSFPKYLDDKGEWKNLAYMVGSIYQIRMQSPLEDGAVLPSPNVYKDIILQYCNAAFDSECELLPSTIERAPTLPEVKSGMYVNNTFYLPNISPKLELNGQMLKILDVSYVYVVLVHKTNGIATFGFDFTISLAKNCQPLKPYSVTDMTIRCLELAEPLFMKDKEPRFIFDGVKYGYTFGDEQPELVREIEDGQAKEYNGVFASELTLSQSTLREQLKTIGGLIHSEPRVEITEDNSGKPIYKVKYDRYDSSKKADLPGTYVSKKVNRSINDYCTGLRSNVSNLVNSLSYGNGTIADPCANAFRTLRTDVVNVRIEEGNACAETAYPIYKIIKVECIIYGTDANGEGIVRIDAVDITSYVLEKSAYDLKSAYVDTFPQCKNNFIYYTQGEKNIDGLFYRAQANATFTNSFNRYAIVNILSSATGKEASEIEGGASASDFKAAEIAFRITYVPIYSAQIGHSKQRYSFDETNFEKVYNQSGNLVEVRYFGENIKGAAARLGNVEEERTYLLQSIKDLPSLGDQTGDGYAICAVRASFLPTHTKCTVSLSKDFNRISQYIGVDSHKRVYEVSEREAYDRCIFLRNKIVFSRKSITNDDLIFATPMILLQSFLDNNRTGRVSAVVASSIDPGGKGVSAIHVLPVVSSAFGNILSFSWRYKDNYSSGTKSTYHSVANISGNWMEDVPYSDYYGKIYGYYFDLVSGVGSSIIENAPYMRNQAFIFPNIAYGISLPTCRIGTTNTGAYLMRKDSREKISVTLGFEFQTTEDDLIIGSALASHNYLISDDDGKPTLYLLKNITIDKFRTNIRDLWNKSSMKLDQYYRANPNSDGTGSYSFESSGAICKLSFKFDNNIFDKPGYAWVIATPPKYVSRTYEDEFGNVKDYEDMEGLEILLASNKGWSPNNYPSGDIFIATKRT